MRAWRPNKKEQLVKFVKLYVKSNDSFTVLKISFSFGNFGILLSWEVWTYPQNLAQFDMRNLLIIIKVHQCLCKLFPKLFFHMWLKVTETQIIWLPKLGVLALALNTDPGILLILKVIYNDLIASAGENV